MIIVVYEKSNDVLNQMNLTAETRETFIPDIQGSVLATLGSGSGVLSKAGYLPFGENASTIAGTFRFAGQRFDEETAGRAAEPSGLYSQTSPHFLLNPLRHKKIG